MPQFTEMRRPALWDEAQPGTGTARSGRSAAAPVWPRTVVLGYDGSEGARSAAARAGEAAGSGGCILVVTAVPTADASELEPEGALVGDPEHLLKEAEALLESEETEVVTRLAAGDPVEALVAAASETAADLVVVGARGHDFVARTLRGSVAERLVSRAPCPVLVAR